MYHRKDGLLVKEGEDAISASRYALMARRYGQSAAGKASFNREIVYPKAEHRMSAIYITIQTPPTVAETATREPSPRGGTIRTATTFRCATETGSHWPARRTARSFGQARPHAKLRADC